MVVVVEGVYVEERGPGRDYREPQHGEVLANEEEGTRAPARRELPSVTVRLTGWLVFVLDVLGTRLIAAIINSPV